MNYKAVFNIIFRLLLVEMALMLLPVVVALIYGEDPSAFLITIAAVTALSGIGLFLSRGDKRIYPREGFVIVALSWVIMSAVGAVPFVISGYIPSFVDAFFETVSGFTTTGATILTDVEALPLSLLFWRSFTHWVGGMGVLVFIMAILPLSNVRSVHIMRAEVPGPTKSKLVPKMKSTAVILYSIYVVMTLVEIILLICGGMPFFDAVVHSFGTAGTGGFGIKNNSIAYYDSAYIQYVISIFMLLFGVNFNLYYFLLIKDIKSIFKSEELRWYLGIAVTAAAVIAINISHLFSNFGESVRYAFFQVSSIMTTTGFSTTDFNQWPSLSKGILVLLMFIGASAGSTGGGMKVSRIIIGVKSVFSEIKRLLHPRSVRTIRLDGSVLDDTAVRASMIFCFAYLVLTSIMSLIVCFDGYDMVTSFTAVVACISNIGPGLELVGPVGNFAMFSAPIKVVLSFAMLLGRLELFPILMLFLPSTWRRT
ncbi:MAG: TrkH family potassium uptake protein [Ruminococcaceae bacterium]|nr:TrkH family potassium uptake protein [Oscillospiraceae bacterium]